MRGVQQLVVLIVAALLPSQLVIAQAVPATGPNVAVRKGFFPQKILITDTRGYTLLPPMCVPFPTRGRR